MPDIDPDAINATLVQEGFLYFPSPGESDVHIACVITEALGRVKRSRGDCMTVLVTMRPDRLPYPEAFKSGDIKEQVIALTAILAKLNLVNTDGTPKVRETAKAIGISPPMVSRVTAGRRRVTLNQLGRIVQRWYNLGLGPVSAEPAFRTLAQIALA